MLQLIKIGSVGYISARDMKVFNKDYGEIMMLVVLLYIGISIATMVGGWYNAFMDSELITLIRHISNLF